MLADEHVQLAMARGAAIGHRYDITVEETSVVAALDESRADRHPSPLRQSEQLLRSRSVRHRLRKRFDLDTRQFSHVPITGHAHLREGNQLDVLPRCLLDE